MARASEQRPRSGEQFNEKEFTVPEEVVGESSTQDPGVKGTGPVIGVQGIGLVPGGFGVVGGPQSQQPFPGPFIGVKGDGGAGLVVPPGIPVGAPHFGVLGTVSGAEDTGVQGESPNVAVSGMGGKIGVFATGDTAIFGSSKTGLAGQFDGNVTINGNLSQNGDADIVGGLVVTKTVTFNGDFTTVGSVTIQGDLSTNGSFNGTLDLQGDLNVSGDVFLQNRGGDIAEQFATGCVDLCDPGTVMAVNDDGQLIPCSEPYDHRVVGIVAGAGGLRPALTLRPDLPAATVLPVAMVGTAYCKVEADTHPIGVGDLLTTSSRAGHAMKAIDQSRSFGAVLGKALAALPQGQGIIPVLVTLQ